MYKKTIANSISLLLAATVTAVAFEWLFFKDNEPVPDDGPKTAQPQWYIKTARIWKFNEDGKRTQLATADRVRYFQEEDIAYLNNPKLTSFAEEGDEVWRTTADFGQFRGDFDTFDLRENVKITNSDDSMTLTTKQLILVQSTNTAETDKPVVFNNGVNKTSAVGMRAWLDQEKVELLADVRTVYEPQ